VDSRPFGCTCNLAKKIIFFFLVSLIYLKSGVKSCHVTDLLFICLQTMVSMLEVIKLLNGSCMQEHIFIYTNISTP